MEGHNLKSELQRAVGWKTFLFLIVSLLILPSILLDSFDALLALFFEGGTGSIFDMLGRVHGEGNGSFYTCIVMQSWSVVPIQLHRLHEVLLGRIVGLLTARSPVETIRCAQMTELPATRLYIWKDSSASLTTSWLTYIAGTYEAPHLPYLTLLRFLLVCLLLERGVRGHTSTATATDT